MEPNGNEKVRKKCRIKPISGIKSFAECLEHNSHCCPHACSFGHIMLCYHPEWEQKRMVVEK